MGYKYWLKKLGLNEIERSEKLNDAVKHLEKEQKDLEKTIKKFESQVSKSIKKFKIWGEVV
jgi:predicted negative regulator of RcsB-dependent stress response